MAARKYGKNFHSKIKILKHCSSGLKYHIGENKFQNVPRGLTPEMPIFKMQFAIINFNETSVSPSPTIRKQW